MKNPAESSKPKVLIVIGVLWRGGGAEKVAASLGNYLTDSGYETHLLTFYEHKEKYPYHGIYHSFDEQPKGKLAKIVRIPVRIFKIYRYAKQHDINVAVSFLEEANFYTLLVKLIFMRRLPVIVSVRNNINTRGWLFRLASRVLYPYAKKVVSVTKAVEEILKTDFKLTNTTTIYNPLDMALIEQQMAEPLPPEHQWLTDASPLLVTLGRFIHQKGQWHLIRAFVSVRAKYPTAQLVILSDGEYREKLEALAAACGVAEAVHFLGKQRNVYQYFAAADVFVFSSLFEGMPNAMLEALAVGLPIVSTDCVSGPREIIAPAVSVSEKLTYPHETPYGILTAPFAIDDAPIWQSSVALPLTDQEIVLHEAIVSVIDRDWTRGPAYTAYRNRVADAFIRERVMAAWDEVML